MISCTQLHDYGDIQDITRSLRHHGDHYICYKEYTCSAWYLYHRVGDMPHDTYGDHIL